MATTINTNIKRVKLVEGASLSALETAINTYITTGVESDERVKSVDVDKYSDIVNVQDLIDQRIADYKNVFSSDRVSMLNNSNF